MAANPMEEQNKNLSVAMCSLCSCLSIAACYDCSYGVQLLYLQSSSFIKSITIWMEKSVTCQPCAIPTQEPGFSVELLCHPSCAPQELKLLRMRCCMLSSPPFIAYLCSSSMRSRYYWVDRT
ncbi:hypothetical protein RHMOL_Rhmol11G0029800 [Rhododendron molle]|uniref:Uncharacterized protein n=2 Tax=Rhododendron molle TaxID=49168 RepID=A0ACC0LN38_RHOML|nr:hypothetical protein RHMOL_Rhmol11G0029800 [Rhododendron molle]KAI8530110.1 hypothetical protein RHMOL_Rhmol11G0029800 [Rhododendron molle]